MNSSGSPPPRARRWVKLGAMAEYPAPDDIAPLFAHFMLSFNQALMHEGVSPHVLTYIEKVYFPNLTPTKLNTPTELNSGEFHLDLAKSTIDGYRDCMKHVENRLDDLTLESTKTSDVTKLLQIIVDGDDVSKTTIGHVKHFISGVFVFAKNRGDFDGINPVTSTKLPKARAKEVTYAYSIDEELVMLDALKDDRRSLAAISLVSWSGVSRSELEGLRWEDRREGHLHIARSVVEGDLKETKTVHRKDAVPIIPELESVLAAYHDSVGSPAEGWMFPSENPERPMRMNNLYRRHIEDVLEKKGITWHGWHAFRRGLATNLSELGVPDDVIQKILRHGEIGVTQKNYRKTRNPKVDAAMKRLSQALSVMNGR
jgi:integrase